MVLEARSRLLPYFGLMAWFGLLAAFGVSIVRSGSFDLAGPMLALLGTASTILTGLLVLSLRRPGRPTLRLDERGLEHAWFGFIPWTDVHRLQFLPGKTTHRLLLGVSDPARYLARKPWISWTAANGLPPPSGGPTDEIEIRLNRLDQDPLLLGNTASRLYARSSPSAVPGCFPGMDIELLIKVLRRQDAHADDPGR